jgi:hypothetical protein
MIDIKDVPIIEPPPNTRFSSDWGPNGLYKHVAKHLFERDERWTQLFDADLIAEAKRQNCCSEKIPKGSAFHHLAIKYQSLVAKILFLLCEKATGHLHCYSYWQHIDNDQETAYQSIEAWDIETKILIIAKSFVRNGEFLPYVLCTAFRPFPKVSGKQIRKKILGRWQEEINSVDTSIFLALHDVMPTNKK